MSSRPSDQTYHQQVLDILGGKTTQGIQMNGAPITIGTSCVYDDFKTPCTSPLPSVTQSGNFSSTQETFTEDSNFSEYIRTQIKCIIEDIDGQEYNPRGIRLVRDQLETALGILKLTADHVDCDDHHVDSTSRHCQTSNGKLSEEDFMTSQESAIQQLIAQNKALLEKQKFQNRRNWGRRGKD